MLNHIDEYGENLKVKELNFPPAIIVHEDDNLLKVLELINDVKIKVIPVLEKGESHKLLGLLSRSDIIKAYYKKITNNEIAPDLKFSRKVAVDIKDLVDFAIKPIKKQANSKGIQLELKIPEDIPKVRADSNKISWVLINLLGNALRYTESGGKITISAKNIDEQVLISVKDTGKGIAKKDQEKIFKKFVSLVDKNQKPSFGLGLSITKEIIEAHNGEIWVDSILGQGSTFTFTLKGIFKDESSNNSVKLYSNRLKNNQKLNSN